MPKVEIRLDLSALDEINRASQASALETMAALRTEIVSAQVTPMNVGTLESSGGAIDQFQSGEELHTTLCIGDTPYARKLYFHPEYNFQKGKNPNAQGRWADHWLPGGDREGFVPDAFKKNMEKRLPE